MEPNYYILLGAPGAGKGTQAAMLILALGIPHVASGDLFREHLSKGTELGLLAKQYMDEGKLVPDDVTVRMVLERLAQPDCAKGAILDGFPRTIAQAQALERALAANGQRIKAALYIKVSTDELLRRLGGRYTCKNCGAVYHIIFDPPKQPGVCDKCGGPLYQRPDDTPETAKKRLDVYFQQTAPLIEYYRQQGLLREIDGEQSIEAVHAALLKVIRGE
ncbi:MAG: adenylate kinase [Anaerolineae bacterium]